MFYPMIQTRRQSHKQKERSGANTHDATSEDYCISNALNNYLQKNLCYRKSNLPQITFAVSIKTENNNINI